ncbi:MAG TPA: cyclase family protein [Thermodesulfobacteriota bacterium]|nr:cyclase family protein [Thermodesulfobacteriota bacterium]
MFTPELKGLITEGKIYDLGQPWYPGIPHHPLHPPFVYGLARKHGDVKFEGGGSSANDLFAFGGHTGTHLDAVGHISKDGKLFGGLEAAQEQDSLRGLSRRNIEETPPIISRGVLLDIPALKRVGVLEKGYPISRKDIQDAIAFQGVEIKPGDVVLVRTGWARYWDHPSLFNDHEGVPGVTLEAARFLVEAGMRLTGTDTTAYEVVPSKSMEVHVFLLAEQGIQIMEMLNLEELARGKVYSFLFVVIPLKIKGGTGSPVRPIAIR